MMTSNMELLNSLSHEVGSLSSSVQLGVLALSNDSLSDNPHLHDHQDHQRNQLPIMTTLINSDMNQNFSAQFFTLGGPNTVPETGKANGNYYNSCGERRRKIKNDREVVHVRARRGQATDSHSLSERLRREKINEKLRCLQELVPGCYKTMGMAVMLDVIITYVQSLQNQIDFLSMKLSAASLFYDFNSSEMEAMDSSMQGTNGYEAQGMGKIVGEGYGGFSDFGT